jgi:hypothetical protein
MAVGVVSRGDAQISGMWRFASRLRASWLRRLPLSGHPRLLLQMPPVLAVLAFRVFSAAPDDVPRSIAPCFTPATSSAKAPDQEGFLQRWLLLEPINKPNRTNAVFTDTCVRNAMNTEYFPMILTMLPPHCSFIISDASFCQSCPERPTRWLSWPNGADLDPEWLHEEIGRNKKWSIPD